MMESQAEKEEAVVDEKVLRVSDELTNGMLLDQVEELEEQKTKLLLSLKDLKEKYEQQKSDQADIYYYLNKKLDENYETIASLEEQILNEQTQREEQEKKLEKRIEELNLKLSSDETKYLAKINEAEEKLQKLKEFSDNKDELESNFEKLLETLELERKQYRELVDENERKSIRERDRFRKECAQQFDDYKLKLQDEADDKLSSRTKKTLNTNKMMKTELAYQVQHNPAIGLFCYFDYVKVQASGPSACLQPKSFGQRQGVAARTGPNSNDTKRNGEEVSAVSKTHQTIK